MDEIKPSFYSVIPATVRYDESISSSAKLLYGEITALCNKTGYCWAGNKYFAELYKVSIVTVSSWISQLIKAGHITSDPGKLEGNARKIFLTTSLNFLKDPIQENLNTPIKENLTHNNTSKNNTSNTKRNKVTFIPPTLVDMEMYFMEKGATKERAKAAFDHYSESEPPWHDTHGNAVRNWKQKCLTNWINKNYDTKKTTTVKRGYTDEELFAPFNNPQE